MLQCKKRIHKNQGKTECGQSPPFASPATAINRAGQCHSNISAQPFAVSHDISEGNMSLFFFSEARGNYFNFFDHTGVFAIKLFLTKAITK